jgi:pimeloyl-ACP methyl ester carboxylesterase
MTYAARRAGVILIHGGLYEPIGPDEFWHGPGVVAGLEKAGLEVFAPSRLTAPTSWIEEAEHLRTALPATRSLWSVVAGSNGCSVAVRMAVDYESVVDRLVLCWPATAGDADVDQAERAPAAMLKGETLRGVSDAELAGITVPVTIIPSKPPNRYHQVQTVDRMLSLIPGATTTRGFPESPLPEFGQHRDAFVATLISFLET